MLCCHPWCAHVPTGHEELQGGPETQLDIQQEDITAGELSRHLLSIGEILCRSVMQMGPSLLTSRPAMACASWASCKGPPSTSMVHQDDDRVVSAKASAQATNGCELLAPDCSTMCFPLQCQGACLDLDSQVDAHGQCTSQTPTAVWVAGLLCLQMHEQGLRHLPAAVVGLPGPMPRPLPAVMVTMPGQMLRLMPAAGVDLPRPGPRLLLVQTAAKPGPMPRLMPVLTGTMRTGASC